MDLICFSHLRWNFVYQRPQHLMTRFSSAFRVFFIEEPVFDTESANLEVRSSQDSVTVIVPHLKGGQPEDDINKQLQQLITDFIDQSSIQQFIAWYYTPLALSFTQNLEPALVIFDCMDELSAFKNAPASLKQKENELLEKADLVFTGGASLYEGKKDRHHSVHLFPSSIDKKHFEKARMSATDPDDQANIPAPRIGFCGVIDERMNIGLLDKLSAEKPEWQIVMVGPVVKIDPATLPVRNNIHYLGPKSYAELPDYLSGWDVAMMPFALNESTKFISPTKTPEYLAAGLPVVSTPVQDVVSGYGEKGLVTIADENDFIKGVEFELEREDRIEWLENVDAELEKNSWDITSERMIELIKDKLETKSNEPLTQKENEYV